MTEKPKNIDALMPDLVESVYKICALLDNLGEERKVLEGLLENIRDLEDGYDGPWAEGWAERSGEKRIMAWFHPQVEVCGVTFLCPSQEYTPVEFDVTEEVLAAGKEAALQWDDDDLDTEHLQFAKMAPQWVRDWQGPFWIEVKESIRNYFANRTTTMTEKAHTPTPVDALRGLKEAGLTLDQVLSIYGESPADNPYVGKLYHDDGWETDELEGFDGPAIVSPCEAGAWVSVWMFVSNDDLES